MAKLTVLGIGNILMRDEGVGVRLMEALRTLKKPWGDDVEFVDGGVGGLNLLNVIESANRLVVLDAADMGLPPGEYRIFEPRQVAPDRSEGRVSMHDMPFLETLELCERFTKSPPTVIFAIQPAVVDFGRELSDQFQKAFEGLVVAAAELLQRTLAQVNDR